jgi:hypothetical protein
METCMALSAIIGVNQEAEAKLLARSSHSSVLSSCYVTVYGGKVYAREAVPELRHSSHLGTAISLVFLFLYTLDSKAKIQIGSIFKNIFQVKLEV